MRGIKVKIMNETEKLLNFTRQWEETSNILLVPCRMYNNSCESECSNLRFLIWFKNYLCWDVLHHIYLWGLMILSYNVGMLMESRLMNPVLCFKQYHIMFSLSKYIYIYLRNIWFLVIFYFNCYHSFLLKSHIHLELIIILCGFL